MLSVLFIFITVYAVNLATYNNNMGGFGLSFVISGRICTAVRAANGRAVTVPGGPAGSSCIFSN